MTHECFQLRSISSKDSLISKKLSWLLRHGAEKDNVPICEEGFVKVSDILQHKSFRPNVTLEDLQRVVACNDKQRFTLRKNPITLQFEIKANQGHTIVLKNPNLFEIPITTTYTEIIHGTYYHSWKKIKREGLKRMKRMHIHFAKGLNSISGIRKNCLVLIYVNIKSALSDGYKFYESENQVILCPGNADGILPIHYFLKVVDYQTSKHCTKYLYLSSFMINMTIFYLLK